MALIRLQCNVETCRAWFTKKSGNKSVRCEKCRIRQKPDPTPEEMQQRIDAINSGWTEEERVRRSGGVLPEGVDVTEWDTRVNRKESTIGGRV